MPNHVVTADRAEFPAPFADDADLAGRSTLVRVADVIPMECVVRGYLTGSGWTQYRDAGAVCGIALPSGLPEVCSTARADLHADHQGHGGRTTCR